MSDEDKHSLFRVVFAIEDGIVDDFDFGPTFRDIVSSTNDYICCTLGMVEDVVLLASEVLNAL